MKQKFRILLNILTITIIIFSTSAYAAEINNLKLAENATKSSQTQTTNSTLNNSTSNNTTSDNTTENDEKNNIDLYCESCILVERSTGRTAYEKDSEKKMYPASTTKVLTAILAVENCKMDDVVTITSEMTSKVPKSYTTAYLKAGEKVTVEQLLNVLLIPSANDAGFALAIHISGSVENFANLMNERAKQLGCTNSNFTNPSGIHDENHYSTAKDMSLIATCAMSYPQLTDIVCKTSYTLSPENSNTRTFETTNSLIDSSKPSYYEYANGFKTGFTDPAGSCIIATAKKEKMEFLAVVLNAPEPTQTTVYRDIDCKNLFEYGFENYEEITKVEEPPVVQIPIEKYFNNELHINITVKISLFILAFLLLLVILKIKKNKKNKRNKYKKKKHK